MTEACSPHRSLVTRRWVALVLTLGMLVGACGGGGAPEAAPTPPPPNAVRVLFTYGSEKQAWIEAVTATYNASNPKTASGRAIIIDPVPVGSLESVDDIVEGRAQPALWSPASRLILPLLSDGWETSNNTQILDENTCKDLVISPTVIMMWRPMAEAMGWPDTQIGWADLAALATNPEGWGAFGRPEWGRFRFGHTHPDYSNSGLQTIVAMAYAAAAKQRGLTIQDVQSQGVQDFIGELEKAVAHYGRSTGFFGNAMAERGTRYLSAAVVYENIVAEKNSDPKQAARLEFPLVAVYPREGTFQSDHPACVLNAPWVDAETREAAGLYRDYLLSNAVQQRALEFGFRPADPQIAIGAPLTLENGVDATQPQNTLAAPSAEVIRAIRDIWGQQKRAVNVTLLMDVSGSMREENRIAGAREGAKAFVDQLADNDLLTLVSFSDGQNLMLDHLNVGQNRDQIKREIDTLIPDGGTSLLDSIAYAIDHIESDADRINAVVVLTDGRDTSSTRFATGGGGDPAQVREATNQFIAQYGMNAELQGPDVSIFTIGYGSDADEATLEAIAEQGRGAYRNGTSADIRSVYLDISTFF